MYLKLGKCLATGAIIYGSEVDAKIFAEVKSNYPTGIVEVECDYDFIVVADYKSGKYINIGVKENISNYSYIASAAITPGVRVRIGIKSKNGKSTADIVSYLFDANKYNMTEARTWIKEHKGKKAQGSIESVYEVALLFEYEDGHYLLTAGNDLYVTDNIIDKAAEIEISLAEQKRYFREGEAFMYNIDLEDIEKLIATEEDK